MTNHKLAFERFRDFLETRQSEFQVGRDIREHVLSVRNKDISIGFVRRNLDAAYPANLKKLFPKLHAVDDPDVPKTETALMLGTIYAEQEKSHAGGTRLLSSLSFESELILIEQGFLASSRSWSHAFREKDAKAACLGYVYDDIAHYFMSDYPNRLIKQLNGRLSPSQDELVRARQLIERIVSQKISKYNAQPFEPPIVSEGYSRRVLVCDQSFADASTVYGRIDEAGFQEMLLAAVTENPDAEILVKSHPDTSWEPDKRAGYFSHLESTGRVRIIREPINPFVLFDLVDTVYVGTSQMGLEALFAGKKVVCFGAPFFAGWGLTDDRRAIPHRRRARTLEEVFHYFYVWYTIYQVPGRKVPSSVEDALDYIESNRPFHPPDVPKTHKPAKVSVIIPVHNVEEYLEECLRSVMEQTLSEIEIIPVNDQSPDKSQEVIERLAAEDNRIRPMVMPENVGQGFARNAAIKEARGEFIWFLDADDYFCSPDVLEEIYEKAVRSQSDMLRSRKAYERVEDAEGNFSHNRSDSSERYFAQTGTEVDIADSDFLLQNRHFWNWLYRRSFLEKNDIRFVTSQWEERPFYLKALLSTDKIAICSTESVVYRVRQKSTARRQKSQKDLVALTTNFSAVVQLLADRRAFERDSPLRRHAEFILSQYLQYLFIGFPYHVAKNSDASQYDLNWLIDITAKTFEDCDFDAEDFDSRPSALSGRHLAARAFQLLIVGIRNRDIETVTRAVELKEFGQKELLESYLTVPQGSSEIALRAAVNKYACNERVKAPARFFGRKAERPRLVFHAGASKTGSTYIQHHMDQNRDPLLREGVWYPEVGLFWQEARPHKQAGHARFTDAAIRNDKALRAYLESGLNLLDGRIHTVVLSSEAFFLQDKSHKIIEYLSDFSCEVVIYLRQQDLWANSQYCEFVGGGAMGRVAQPIEAWLEDKKTRSRMDYLTTLRRFESVVPREKIHVRLFESSQLVDGDVLSDFAHAANIPILNKLPRPDAKNANEARMSEAQIQLLRHFNSLEFESTDSYLKFIEDVSVSLSDWRRKNGGAALGSPMLLSRRQRLQIRDDYRKSNEEIAREWLGKADGQLFEEKPIDGSGGEASISAAEIAIVQTSFERWKAKDRESTPTQSTQSKGNRRPLNEQFRIVNYGLFGWRLWLLTPWVRAAVQKRATSQDLEQFNRDPAGYMHSLKSEEFKKLAVRLYPQKSVYGPWNVFSLWVPLVSGLASVIGGKKYANGLRKNPVLFFRLLRNPIYRALGRLLFPIGELKRVNPD